MHLIGEGSSPPSLFPKGAANFAHGTALKRGGRGILAASGIFSMPRGRKTKGSVALQKEAA